MSERWAVVARPDAVLTPIDPVPIPRDDGATWQRFSTANGVTFAQVIESSGRVMWLQMVTS